MNKKRIFYPYLVWIVSFFLFAAVFIQIDYRARENDSRLYTKFLQQLSMKPLQEIVVVHWMPSHYMDRTSPYVRDHLIGQFLIPAVMVKLGVPASHALYLFNNLVQIAIMYGLFYLGFLLTGHFYPDLLFFVGLLPQAWVYTLRANHEQPLALMAILAMIAGIKLKVSRWWFALAVTAVVGAFLIKGMGFMMVPLAFVAGYFFSFGIHWKKWGQLIFYSVGITLLLALTLWGYEQWFHSLTGESFFTRYWEIQIVGRSLETDTGFSLMTKLKNFNYYFSRTLAYVLPWSLIFIVVAARKREQLAQWWRENRPWLLTLGGYTLFYMLVFSMVDRKASRYLYPAYYFAYLLFAMGLYKLRPRWSLASKSFFQRDDRRVHWIAAGVWLFLHLLSLIIYVARGGYGYWVK